MSTNRFNGAESLPELVEQLSVTRCASNDVPGVVADVHERLTELGVAELS